MIELTPRIGSLWKDSRGSVVLVVEKPDWWEEWTISSIAIVYLNDYPEVIWRYTLNGFLTDPDLQWRPAT